MEAKKVPSRAAGGKKAVGPGPWGGYIVETFRAGAST
jgi:hypothetical protein